MIARLLRLAQTDASLAKQLSGDRILELLDREISNFPYQSINNDHDRE